MTYIHDFLLSVVSLTDSFTNRINLKKVNALAPAVAAAIVVFFTSTAALALTQPNGASIPAQMGCSGSDPTGLAPVFACSCIENDKCNIGAACPWPGPCDQGQNGTCETTLYHSVNDNSCIPSNHTGLDPWTEAATEPETFYPEEALTFTVVSRGTAMFKNAFGWYNVTGSAPSASDLHTILDCNAAAGSSQVIDIKHDPAWAGGKVGFFLITPESHTTSSSCEGSDCCATVVRLQAGVGYAYYSQKEFSPDDYTGVGAYIHMLVYQSRITESKFYFAFEDTFGGSNNDFTDLVTSVEGVSSKKSGSGMAAILAWLARSRNEGGCHTDVAGGGLGGGLILALTAASLVRRRRR